MERFVARRNVEHYRELLKRTSDPAERRRLQAMLAEARAELERQTRLHADGKAAG